MLGFYLFSLSMQKCGRNLMLVSQTDDPRLCPFPVRMKPASSLCRLPSFSSSSIISNPVKKTLYLMTSLVFAYLNHHSSWGQCFAISLFLFFCLLTPVSFCGVKRIFHLSFGQLSLIDIAAQNAHSERHSHGTGTACAEYIARWLEVV